jgi:hypothetical protein
MAGALTKIRHNGVTIHRCQLTESAVATEDGVWVNIEGLSPFSIHVSGITTGTVQIRGSNDATVPANNTDDIQLGSDITADGITEYTVPIRWIKSKVSAWTTGTFIVEFVAKNK